VGSTSMVPHNWERRQYTSSTWGAHNNTGWCV
jgi:hypothetical protein